MKYIASFAIALVFGSAPLIAQNAAHPNAPFGGNRTLTILQLPPIQVGCPVQMLARHESGRHTVYVGKQALPEPSGMRLKFTLTSPRPDLIARASITVRGLNRKSHVVQANGGAASSDIERTMSVDLAPGEGRNSVADLVAPGFVVVSSIKLNSVTYASGSTWKFAGNKVCQVSPDPLMLVDAQMAP